MTMGAPTPTTEAENSTSRAPATSPTASRHALWKSAAEVVRLLASRSFAATCAVAPLRLPEAAAGSPPLPAKPMRTATFSSRPSSPRRSAACSAAATKAPARRNVSSSLVPSGRRNSALTKLPSISGKKTNFTSPPPVTPAVAMAIASPPAMTKSGCRMESRTALRRGPPANRSNAPLTRLRRGSASRRGEKRRGAPRPRWLRWLGRMRKLSASDPAST